MMAGEAYVVVVFESLGIKCDSIVMCVFLAFTWIHRGTDNELK